MNKFIRIDNSGNSIAKEISADEINNARFVFTQAMPADNWSILHNLNRKVVVQLYNEAGIQTEGEVDIINDNLVIVKYPYPMTGTAILI